mmetsp:Transcript_15512/g.33597  ORF Transcript_15512/g.33597 Transcript_15512/m.33597 type:complete len:265 (+) Transcript_15512:1019-1813(+)
MDGSKKNTTLTVDIGPVFRAQGGLEHEGRSNSNTPSKSKFSGLARFVLVDSEGGVDSSSVDLLTLFVKTTDGRTHTLGAHGNHIHILGEILSDGFKVSEQETVGKTKGGTGLHGGKDLLVKGSLGSITDEKHDQVTLSNDIIHFTEGIGVFAEANLTGLLERGRSFTKTNTDLNVASNLVEGVTHVLCLSGCLGTPSDDANFLDALEGFREFGEEITSSFDDLLFCVGEFNIPHFKNFGGEGVEGRARHGNRARRGIGGKGSRR